MTDSTQPGWSDASLGGFDPREARIGELVNDFFDRRQRGERLSIDEFVAAHPEFAADLRKHLDGLRLFGQFGSSNEQTLPAASPAGRGGGSSGGLRSAGSPVVLPEIEGYELQRELGRGGMGVVFKAMQKSTKRVVALKVLLEGEFASESAQRRFEREVELAAQLRHPNIIPIYDSGRSGGRMYYAMEYVHGRPLTEHVRTLGAGVDERLKLFDRICGAVAHAHLRGVVHRDLKPANILVDADGEPHVLDFGLAKIGGMQDMAMSITAQVIGTPAYMAPEQVAGDPSAIDPRTDVYALGVVLYEMLTGAMPYPTQAPLGEVLNHITQTEPTPPRKKSPGLKADVETIILKALTKRKDDRYQTVHALSSDVRHYLAGEPIAARPASALYLLGRALWPHRHFAAAILVIVLLGGAIAGLLLRQRAANLRQQDELRRVQQERLDAERRAAEARALQEHNDEKWAQIYANFFQTAPKESAQALKAQLEKMRPAMRPEEFGVSLLKEAANLVDKSTPGFGSATQPASAPAENPDDGP